MLFNCSLSCIGLQASVKYTHVKLFLSVAQTEKHGASISHVLNDLNVFNNFGHRLFLKNIHNITLLSFTITLLIA